MGALRYVLKYMEKIIQRNHIVQYVPISEIYVKDKK